MGDGGPGTGDRKVTTRTVAPKYRSGSRLHRTSLLVIAVAGVVLGVVFGVVGMAAARQSGRASSPKAVRSHPKRAWWAAKPPGTPLGLRHGFYTTMAASGNVMVGITFASPEGSLLVRFDPTDGKLLWIAPLPTMPNTTHWRSGNASSWSMRSWAVKQGRGADRSAVSGPLRDG